MYKTEEGSVTAVTEPSWQKSLFRKGDVRIISRHAGPSHCDRCGGAVFEDDSFTLKKKNRAGVIQKEICSSCAEHLSYWFAAGQAPLPTPIGVEEGRSL